MKALCFLLFVATITTGCHLYENDAPCPCASGWMCCAGANVCAKSADLCPAPEGPIVLTQTRSMAGAMPIAGIDTDRAGGLWIAYQPTDSVHVVHLDASGATLSDWTYTDDITEIHGLAYGLGGVWLNYNGITQDSLFLRKLDASTGAELKRFATDYQMTDLDAGGDTLLALKGGDMISIDPNTGGVLSRTVFTGYDSAYYGQGVASVGSQVWLSAWNSNTLYLAGHDGKIERGGATTFIADEALRDVFLAWDGTSVIVEVGNQITWLTPQGPI
jgi:hypothetical protein